MKRKIRKLDPAIKEVAFGLFCFALSQKEIASKLKVDEDTVCRWNKSEHWTQRRQIVLREQAEANGKSAESERNACRQNELDMSRRCWAMGSLALSRLNLQRPKTQDIKNLLEIASLLNRRALNMPMHEAMELTVNHQFGDQIDEALRRVLARRNGEPKAIELASAPA